MKYWKAYAIAISGVVLLGAATTIPSQLFFKANGTGAVTQSFAGKLGQTINVTDFYANGVSGTQAVCDGSTDVGGAINAALTAACSASAVTSTVMLPSGTCITGQTILIPTTCPVTLAGQGIQATVLKLKASSNVDVISQSNWSTLTGTSGTTGVFRIAIRDMTIDGNKTNQTALVTTTTATITSITFASGTGSVVLAGAPTPAITAGMTVNIPTGSGLTNANHAGRYVVKTAADSTHFTISAYNQLSTASTGGVVTGYSGGNGIRLFGRAFIMQNLVTQNCTLDGQWSDGADTGTFTNPNVDDLESIFQNLRHINNGGDGMVFGGPHDSRFISMDNWGNGQWGHEFMSSAFIYSSESFLNTAGGMHTFTGGILECSVCEESTATGWSALLESPFNIFSATVFGGGTVGLEVRHQGNNIQGVIGNTTGSALKINNTVSSIAGGTFSLVLSGGNSGVRFDVNGMSADSSVTAWDVDSTGTLFSGTPKGTWFVDGALHYHQMNIVADSNGDLFKILTGGSDRMRIDGNGSILAANNLYSGGSGQNAVLASKLQYFGVTPVILTGQNANIAAQNIYAAAPAGIYRVCATALTTTSGTGTTATLNLLWTDEGGAKTDLVGTWALNSVTVTGQINKCDVIHAAAATNIQVSTTAGTYGTSVYALYGTVDRLF